MSESLGGAVLVYHSEDGGNADRENNEPVKVIHERRPSAISKVSKTTSMLSSPAV